MLQYLRLRVRHAFARYGLPLAVVLLLVGAGAAGAGVHSYRAGPETRTVTTQTHQRTVSLALRDSAVVTGETTLWQQGTRLTTHPVYLRSAMPHLTLTALVDIPANQRVTVTTWIRLKVRAVYDGTVYWSDTRTLARKSTRVADGTARTAATVNVTALDQRLDAIRSRLGDTGTLEVVVHARTQYRMGRYNGTLSAGTPLEINDRTYIVPESPTTKRTHATEAIRRVPVERLPRLAMLAGGVALLALVGAGVALWGRRREDPDRLRAAVTRERYAEWISVGDVPTGMGTIRVQVETLEGLVDVGIDANRRVVHDPDRDRYAVLVDDVLYYWDARRDR